VKRKKLAARAVLLDWDGTLLNSFDSDSRAYLAMFRAIGIDWGMRDLVRHYSPNWHNVYRAAGLRRSLWAEADRLWHEAYEKESPALLPGARRVIRKLAARVRLGIVTSGTGWRVRQQLRKFKLHVHFATCVCAEDASHRKPHPAPLRLALRQMRVKPVECVYVGDSPDDVFMARGAGVRVIGVRGPFPTAKRVLAAGPDLMLDSIAELPDWIEALPASRRH
jgi:HAD superfamily hydrolase (TIGR01549 family)